MQTLSSIAKWIAYLVEIPTRAYSTTDAESSTPWWRHIVIPAACQGWKISLQKHPARLRRSVILQLLSGVSSRQMPRAFLVRPRTSLTKWGPHDLSAGSGTFASSKYARLPPSLLPVMFMKRIVYLVSGTFSSLHRQKRSCGGNFIEITTKIPSTTKTFVGVYYNSPVQRYTWWKVEMYMFAKKLKHRITRDHQRLAAARPEGVGALPQEGKGPFLFCSEGPAWRFSYFCSVSLTFLLPGFLLL